MSSRPSRGAARLAAILDALPDALLLVNCNGTVVNANTIALETFETPGTALVGRGLLDLLPEFDSKRIPGSMRRPEDVAEETEGRTKPTRMVARRTDGTEFPVEVTSANLADGRTPYASAFEAAFADHGTGRGPGSGGGYTGDELLMLVVRDLAGTLDTEAELARQQRQTEMILRAASEGVVGVDAEGRVVLVNPAAAQILGFRASDLGGQELHPLVHHSRADGTPLAYEETPLADTLRSGRKHRVRAGQVLWAKDGHAVPVDMTTAPVRDGEQLVGAVLTFTDRRPYDSVAARHGQLQAVLGEALRGPLEQLRGELAGLAADPAGQLWPEANQILHHLSAGYSRMTKLVDNVLDFQRLDAGRDKLRPELVSLDTVVAAGVEGAVELIGPGRAQFAVHAPPIEAEVDPEKLSTALAHLVADVAGVDATGQTAVAPPPGVDPTIVVAAAQRGDVVRIDVRGPHAGGSPVHEPVVRGIVERHGGVLQTHEVPGAAGGSAYVLEVPVSAGGAAAAPGTGTWRPKESSETTVMPVPAEPARGTGGAAQQQTPGRQNTPVQQPAQPQPGQPQAGRPQPGQQQPGQQQAGQPLIPAQELPEGEAAAPAPTGRRRGRPSPAEEQHDQAANGSDSDTRGGAFALPPAGTPTGSEGANVPLPSQSSGRRARRALADPADGRQDTGDVRTGVETPSPAQVELPGQAQPGTGRRARAVEPGTTEASAEFPEPYGQQSGSRLPAQGRPGSGGDESDSGGGGEQYAAAPGGALEISSGPASGGRRARRIAAAQARARAQAEAAEQERHREPFALPPVTEGAASGAPVDPADPVSPGGTPDPRLDPAAGGTNGGGVAGGAGTTNGAGFVFPDGPPGQPQHGQALPGGVPQEQRPGQSQPGAASQQDPHAAQDPHATQDPNASRDLHASQGGGRVPAQGSTPEGSPVPGSAGPVAGPEQQPQWPEPGSLSSPETQSSASFGAEPFGSEPFESDSEQEAPEEPKAVEHNVVAASPILGGGALPQRAPSQPQGLPMPEHGPSSAPPSPYGAENAPAVRTLGQGMPFSQHVSEQAARQWHGQTPAGPSPAPAIPSTPSTPPASAGSGRRRKLATPPDEGDDGRPQQEGQTPPTGTTGGPATGAAPAQRTPPPPGPMPMPQPAPQNGSAPGQTPAREFTVGSNGASVTEGPEPLDGPDSPVEVTDGRGLAMPPHARDDELPPEPLDNPRRLLVWPEPDVSTQQALSDRGYRPVLVHSREEVDAQIAAYPAALFVDPLTGPITRTALQSLRVAAVAAEVPVLVTAGLGQATREAAYGADPAVLLKALAPRDSEQHPPRVLLVEEHEAIAGALTATLERRGMQVAHAATDADAVNVAAQVRPNLVVMDLMQVRRRRAGIIDWLRVNGLLSRTPFVVYTSADIDPAELPRLASGETVLFLAERSTSPEVQARIVDLLTKIGAS